MYFGFPKASHLVAQKIRQEILSGNAQEGAPLRSVREMVDRLGVASTTVREALRVLEAEGLVTIKPGPKGGVFVRRPSHESITKQLAFLLQFENTSLSSILEARRLLEPICARLAASRANAHDMQALEESIDRLEQLSTGRDPFAWVRENAEYHMIVATAARNDVLRIFLTSLRELIHVSTIPVSGLQASRTRTIMAHRNILAAIKDHDSDRAEDSMLEHLLSFEKALTEAQAIGDPSSGLLMVLPGR